MQDPVPDKRKYFFAWHLTNGIPFGFKFMTDDGLPVGGIPDTIGDIIELSKEEFDVDGVSDLQKKHPLHGVIMVTLYPMDSSG